MLRSRLLRARLPSATFSQRRSIHKLPPLEHFQDGIPELLTPQGFQIAWTEYQTLMLEKLNALTAGSVDDHSSTTKNLLLKYARQPNMASLFNHASMAHNNHFFFSCLSKEQTEVPSILKKGLEKSFNSMETLKKEFIATGNSMFGPGYVWLVQLPSEERYAILNTYIAGSPYPGAHWRRQTVDMNTASYDSTLKNPADYSRRDALMASLPVNTVGAHGPMSKHKTAPGGVSVNPILCVSTWEHVYMPDWGVLQKKEYLEAWWDRINWETVATYANAHKEGRGPSRFVS